MTEPSDTVGPSGRDVDLLASPLITKYLIVLIALATISAVQMVRIGVSRNAAQPGSSPGPDRSPRIHSAATWFSSKVSGACSLLLQSVAVGVLLVSSLYIIGGYAVVSSIYRVSELCGAANEGRIKLAKSL